MKYIDADLLKKEIERQKSLFSTEKGKEGLSKTDKLSLGARIATLEETVVLIDSLQQEQQEVDLEAFRREAAKDAMNGMLSAPQFWQNVWSHNPVNGKCNYPRQIALFAIACADELIKQLKEEKQ